MISGSDVAVVTAGVGAIAWVNWYFFTAGASRAEASGMELEYSEMQEQIITVHGGYDPSVIRVKAGRPVRLVFDRQDTGGCSEEVVFPDFGLRRYLPAGERTIVEVLPAAAGRYEFTCGMSMLRGALIAEG